MKLRPCARLLAGALTVLVLYPAAALASYTADDLGRQASKKRLAIKPTLSAFWPSDARVRNRFGNSWASIGLSAGFRDEAREKNRFELRADGIVRKTGSDHVYMLPMGGSLKHRFATEERVSTYAGVGAYLCPVDIESQADSVDTGLRMISGASVFVGANLGRNVTVEASYYKFSPIKGYDLSGLRAYACVYF